MYEDLIKRLRNCTSDTVEDCAGCPYQGGYKGTYCMNGLISEAANAIETLYAAYTESFSVIAKAFRNNPKDLALREYMMKNACCCEAEEGEL